MATIEQVMRSDRRERFMLYRASKRHLMCGVNSMSALCGHISNIARAVCWIGMAEDINCKLCRRIAAQRAKSCAAGGLELPDGATPSYDWNDDEEMAIFLQQLRDIGEEVDVTYLKHERLVRFALILEGREHIVVPERYVEGGFVNRENEA